MWSNLHCPVLLPYFGAETVTKDSHSLTMLLVVLRGDFETCTVGEVLLATSDGVGALVADGLFAVRQEDVAHKLDRPPLDNKTELLQVSCCPHVAAALTSLLQVACANATSSSARKGVCVEPKATKVCYLITDDVRAALHLQADSPRAHLCSSRSRSTDLGIMPDSPCLFSLLTSPNRDTP